MTDIDLARRADAAARSVDGVVRLYSATPIPARLARQITSPEEVAPLSVVERVDNHLEVTICLGVATLRAAGSTASRVAGTVREALVAEGNVHVHVRVSRATPD